MRSTQAATTLLGITAFVYSSPRSNWIRERPYIPQQLCVSAFTFNHLGIKKNQGASERTNKHGSLFSSTYYRLEHNSHILTFCRRRRRSRFKPLDAISQQYDGEYLAENVPAFHRKVNNVTVAKSLSAQKASSFPYLPAELCYDTSCWADEKNFGEGDEFTHLLIQNAMDIEDNGILKNGWMLLDYQKRAILHALRRRRMILAYDMGLGKTLIACLWASSFIKALQQEQQQQKQNETSDFQGNTAGVKVIVLAPKTIHSSWMTTVRDCTDLFEISPFENEVQLDCRVLKTSKNRKRKRKESSVEETMSADTTNVLSPSSSTVFEIHSWGKVPSVPSTLDVARYVVICDEAHYMQNMEAQRTKAALALLDDRRCVGCLLLTGTPMKNGKPKNIYPLLRGVRHPLTTSSVDNQMEFEKYFCNGQYKNINFAKVWDASGARNLSTLKSHIAPIVMYMSKEQALKDLPGIAKRGTRTVSMTLEYEKEYIKAVDQLTRMLADSEVDMKTVLGATQRVRMIAAEAKIDGTVELANDLLNNKNEPAVVIFTNFVGVAKRVHERMEDYGFASALLTGEVSETKRQNLIDEFQSSQRQVFVATYGTGGVGLTLTASRVVILLDRPWTPGDVAQAEDRVRRIGQTRPVLYVWMRCCDWDVEIDKFIESKQQRSNAVIVSSTGTAGSTTKKHVSSTGTAGSTTKKHDNAITGHTLNFQSKPLPDSQETTTSIYHVIRTVASNLRVSQRPD